MYNLFRLRMGVGEGGPLYRLYRDMCGAKGYGFSAVLV